MSAEINLINNLLVTAGANLSIEDLTGTVLVSDTPVLDNFHALKRLPTDFKYIQNNKYCQENATTKKQKPDFPGNVSSYYIWIMFFELTTNVIYCD